jgi:cytochrome c biogenesis protein CcmG/thiol:disulfide interchange protein DsbE
MAVAGCDSDDEVKSDGSVASDFTVETLGVPSATATLSKKRGKVVLLDFWATWCGPCKQISPVLDSLYDRYKSKGLEAMAITPEAREVVAINEKKNPHSMPVYLDTDGSAADRTGAKAFPTIVVVARDGRIAYSTKGVGDKTAEELEAAVSKALEQN